MSRREFVGGAAAAAAMAGTGHGARFGEWMSAATETGGGAPQDLLSRAFPRALLAKQLVSQKDWKPFPVVTDRAAWEALPASVRAESVARAEKHAEIPVPVLSASGFMHYHLSGSRQPYDDALLARRMHLNALVLGECVEAKGRFLVPLVDVIWAMCEESFWGIPAHIRRQAAGEGLPDPEDRVVDLYTAQAAMDLALVASVLGPTLDTYSPMLVKRIRYEVKQRLLVPSLERDDQWWMGIGPNKDRRVNNWNPWICSGWMMALLLVEDDPKKRVDGAAKILHCIDQFVNRYPADAGEEEGPGYWSRSPLSYFECASTIVAATGGTSDVLKTPFIRAMGEYIVKSHIAGEMYTNYGDAHLEAHPNAALVYSFGKECGSPTMTAFGLWLANHGDGRHGDADAERPGFVAHEANEDTWRVLRSTFLTATLRAGGGKSEELLRDAWYPKLGFMAAREKEGAESGFYVALQAAATNRSHGHADSGSFLVYHEGEGVFVDLGAATYTKQTFSDDRGSIWSVRSPFHNLPTVGGVEEGFEHSKAKDLTYATDDAGAQVSCDLAGAFPAKAGMEHWTRTLRLDRTKRAVALREEFALTKAVPVMLTFMTPRVPDAANHGLVKLPSLKTGGKTVVLRYDSAALGVKVEKISLASDRGLHAQWGDWMYRVLLTSQGDVKAGDWAMSVTAEE